MSKALKSLLAITLALTTMLSAVTTAPNIRDLKLHDYSVNSISKEGEVDMFRFTLKHKSRVVVKSSFLAISNNSQGFDTDTYGYILDSNKNIIAEDDDSGYNTHFKIVKYLKAGTYYLKVRGYDSSVTGVYTLSFDAFIYDPEGESLQDAYSYKINTSHRAKIDEEKDIDIYSIDVDDKGELAIFTTGSTDTYCYLLDSNGNNIVEDDDSGKDTNCKIKTTLNKGKYYLKIREYSQQDTGNYTLSSDFKYTDEKRGKSFQTAIEMDLNSTKHGKVFNRGDENYYKFTLNKPKIVKVCYPDTGFMAKVYTSDYQEIDRDEIFIYYNKHEFGGYRGYCDGRNKDSMTALHQVLDTGTYYIKIHGALKNRSYFLKLSAHPIVYIGDTIDDALDMEENKTYSAAIEAYDDIDIYSFALNKKETVKISYSFPRRIKGSITLLDSNGNKIDIKKRNSKYFITTLDAGKYFIKIKATDKLTTYDLSYSKISIVTTAGSTLGKAFPLKEKKLYTIYINDVNSQQIFKIKLDKKASISVGFKGGLESDYRHIPESYTILDSNGNQVSMHNLEAGEYYIKVSGFNKGSYSYKISYHTF